MFNSEQLKNYNLIKAFNKWNGIKSIFLFDENKSFYCDFDTDDYVSVYVKKDKIKLVSSNITTMTYTNEEIKECCNYNTDKDTVTIKIKDLPKFENNIGLFEIHMPLTKDIIQIQLTNEQKLSVRLLNSCSSKS